MERIGLYKQLTEFTTQHAGTAEWCKAERNDKIYFVKKFQSPVYPSKEIGLPERMYQAGVAEFKETLEAKKNLYQRLRDCDQVGILVVPVEVMNYQFHVCTIAEYVTGNVKPEQICELSEWQKLVLMRTLTLALMNVHKAGVVHSDMKPDNLLITQEKNGHCKLRLIDFDGSFLEENPPADSEEIVGDPAFFAPEAYMQSVDEDIRLDHRIDIFALGIIFHYMWCGKYPQKPEDATIGECMLRGDKIALEESIPLAIRQLIQRMITMNPEDRLPLQTVYNVLGVQVGQHTPSLVNLQPAHPEAETSPKDVEKAEIRIECHDEDGKTLKYRSMKVPYGTKVDIKAEEIDGYYVVGAPSRMVSVDKKGNTTSPIIFDYKSKIVEMPSGSFKEEKPKKESKKSRKLLLALLILFLIYCGVMYGLCVDAYNRGKYGLAKQYMDALPFFSTVREDIYNDNLKMLEKENGGNASSTSNSVRAEAGALNTETATPRLTSTTKPTFTPKPTATPAPARTFALNAVITKNKGRRTVSWKDSANAYPYKVSFQCLNGDNVIHPFYWAGGTEELSITDGKLFTIDYLVPGNTYGIEVQDCNDVLRYQTYTIAPASTFVDGSLKASSIDVEIEPRMKDSSADYTATTRISSLNSDRIIKLMGSKDYGIRYEIKYPEMSNKHVYFTQIVFTAPNGYVECEVCSQIEYESTNHYWYLLGDWTFMKNYECNNTIPNGNWKVDLYWDGMHVNTSYFEVV